MPRPAILHALSGGNESTRGGARLVLSSKVTSNYETLVARVVLLVHFPTRVRMSRRSRRNVS